MRRKRKLIQKIKFSFLILVLLSLSGVCIYYGIYFNNLSKSSNIINSNLEKLSAFSKPYVLMELKHNVGDDFSIDGSIKYNLSSDLYYNQAATDVESKKKYNYINNLNKINNTFIFKQDRKNKKLYYEINNKIGLEDIYSSKFYSENSTKYSLVNGILSNYVNRGNFNYFENYGEDINTIDNIEYLYDYFFKALGNAIPKDEINSSNVSLNINGADKYLHKVSVKFNNIVIRDTMNNLFDELRKDERANNIISNIYGDFANYSFDDENFYLDSDENYTISVYTDRLFFKPLKYEIVHIHGNDRKTYYYEILDDCGRWVVVDGDNVLYSSDVVINKKSIDAKIVDSKSNDIGYLKLNRDNTGIDFNYSLDSAKSKEEIIYSSKTVDTNKNHSYTNTRKLSLKFVDNNVTRLSGTIDFSTNVTDEVSIMEDVSNSVLYSTLKEDVKEKFDNRNQLFKERMEK